MSKFGSELIESLTDALAHARNEPSGVRVHQIEVPDVRAIRRGLHMSQQEFAETFRIPLPTLKNWEQGRRHPDAPASAYLFAISKRPREISSAFTPEPVLTRGRQ
jgi:putative transcriptional regulator